MMVRNGGVESPSPRPHLFQSTVSQRRFNFFIFLFRLAAFSFTLTAAVFMLTTTNTADSLRWYNFAAFRFVVAANAIVAFYSFFEMIASVWEISRGSTIFPEFSQVWFDFGHDQVFAYLLLSAGSAGTELARQLRGVATCTASNSFCIQSDIAVALGFVGFFFLIISSLLSGFRAVCFIINGSRFLL